MKKATAFLAAMALTLSMVACGAPAPQETTAESTAAVTEAAEETAAAVETTAEESAATESVESEAAEAAGLPTTDPSGAAITVPEDIQKIAVLAPATAETLIALGHGDKIVAYDMQSVGLEGLPESDVVLDMMQPDMEQLMAVKPDVLFVSAMTLYDQESPYQALIDMGVCVICIPTAESVEGVKNDIAFLASVFGEPEKGEALIAEMDAEIERIAAIGQTITDKKSVYFEIAAAPDMYSFGSDVFLNELIELIGAENVLADNSGWMSVSEEVLLAANPDVILTNVTYVENPAQEIMDRSGWDALTAVQNKDVYYIDNMASSLPNQNIVKALQQMAEAVYPEYYTE